jgi:hypothetical protein
MNPTEELSQLKLSVVKELVDTPDSSIYVADRVPDNWTFWTKPRLYLTANGRMFAAIRDYGYARRPYWTLYLLQLPNKAELLGTSDTHFPDNGVYQILGDRLDRIDIELIRKRAREADAKELLRLKDMLNPSVEKLPPPAPKSKWKFWL